jgi:hypothetical protein
MLNTIRAVKVAAIMWHSVKSSIPRLKTLPRNGGKFLGFPLFLCLHEALEFRRTMFTDIQLDTEQLIHEVEEALTRYPQTSSAEKTQWELFHFIPPFRQNP